MSDPEQIDLAEARAEAAMRQVDAVARHLFICIGPDCIDAADGEKLWSHVKSKVAEAQKQCTGATLYRSKVGCLRICKQGATAVVYPDGTWYGGLDNERVDRVIEEHLVGGQPVEDFRIGQSAFPQVPAGD
jgi:(2Fe-2S) ferredoxin